MNVKQISIYNRNIYQNYRLSFGQKKQNYKQERQHFLLADPYKAKLPPYVSQEVKEDEINSVNEARTQREIEWKNYLDANFSKKNTTKIWDALAEGISTDKRIIPPPIDTAALNPIFSTDLSARDFAIQYNSNLIENALNDITSKNCYEKTLLYSKDGDLLKKSDISIDNQTALWIRIPSKKKDSGNNPKNVYNVERLSNPNWCTRSKVFMADETLKNGDFFVYVEKKNDLWSSEIGIAMNKGKVQQIQGKANDYLIPFKYFENITNFLKKNNYISYTSNGELKNLNCETGYTSEGPSAFTQMLISNFLNSFC